MRRFVYPVLMSLTTVPTPRVAVDLSRLRANIAAMQALASKAGVRLRPHSKTHKSPVVARWQIEAGAVGICCAKLGEAEVMAEAGIEDIRLPYPVNPSNAERVFALQDKTRLSIIVDDIAVARDWSARMQAAGRRLRVLVKVDVGFHRCGVNPEGAAALETIRDIAGLSGLEFLGLLSHAGHAYHAHSVEEILDIARHEAEILNGLASEMRKAGRPVEELSVGSTPTARFIQAQKGVTEMRPGNYVFFDRTQAGLESARVNQCALHVMAMVVSRPAPTRVVFDAGSKVLTSDGIRGFGQPTGHGLVFPSLDADTPDASIVIERLSEEHGVARVPASCALRIGDRVRILPNHSCTVTNLTDELLLVDGLEIVDRLPVAARGRTW
jgi:D-serine deaminase-like pyridoxal phosphate-dependent protein